MIDSKVSSSITSKSVGDVPSNSSWCLVQEFLRPIVTPFELELALTSKAWTGQYILDFGELLSSSTFGQDQGQLANEGEDGAGESAEERDEEAPVYSATTGKYRHPKKYYQNGVKGKAHYLCSVVHSSCH